MRSLDSWLIYPNILIVWLLRLALVRVPHRLSKSIMKNLDISANFV